MVRIMAHLHGASVPTSFGFSYFRPLSSNRIEMRDVPAATVNSTMCPPLRSGGNSIPTVKDVPESGFQCSVYDRRFIENPDTDANGNPIVGTDSNVFCCKEFYNTFGVLARAPTSFGSVDSLMVYTHWLSPGPAKGPEL